MTIKKLKKMPKRFSEIMEISHRIASVTTEQAWEQLMTRWEKYAPLSTKEAVSSLITLCAHVNAKWIVYTLELAEGNGQNDLKPKELFKDLTECTKQMFNNIMETKEKFNDLRKAELEKQKMN